MSTPVLIPVGKTFAMVDAEDVPLITGRKWNIGGGGYAIIQIKSSTGKRGSLYMHRVIIGAQIGEFVDHKNGNKLDNRKENLRKCTHSQNIQNSKPRRNKKTSQYKGVSWDKKKSKWLMQVGGTFGGYYTSELEAAKAYNEKATRMFGEFVKPNNLGNS